MNREKALGNPFIHFTSKAERQQERQCTYNVTLRDILATTVAVEKE